MNHGDLKFELETKSDAELLKISVNGGNSTRAIAGAKILEFRRYQVEQKRSTYTLWLAGLMAVLALSQLGIAASNFQQNRILQNSTQTIITVTPQQLSNTPIPPTP